MPDERRTIFETAIRLLPLVAIALVGLALASVYSGIAFGPEPTLTPISVRTLTPTATGTPTRTPTATGTPTATRDAGTPTPTVGPGGSALVITPAPDAVGWVSSADGRANHLGDYSLNAGVYSTTVYLGLVQFDLSNVPPNTPLQYAALELMGSSRDRLGAGGEWRIELLSGPIDREWKSVTYAQAHTAAGRLLGPPLAATELLMGKNNVIAFSPEAMRDLQGRFGGQVSFRISGPASGANNLFTWEARAHAGGMGGAPVMRIGIGPLAPTSTPTWVVVTSTPTPLNEATASARAATATFVAQSEGTPTPLPPNFVTPVLVTPTPQAPDIYAAATRSAVMTAEAIVNGTATPTPQNWVVALFVTTTPTPVNAATAAYMSRLATAAAATTGTPTPFPGYVIVVTPGGLPTETPTATPSATPLFYYETLTPAPTATPTPPILPGVYRGRIGFLSDRNGSVAAYIMDADGANVARLSNLWPYQFALVRDKEANGGALKVAVLGNIRVGTKIVLIDARGGQQTLYDNQAINYDPAFAPDGYKIAFVSTQTGHDEIYTIGRGGNGFAQLTLSTWEWNKHPSWSPTGDQIVWWSNRETGHRQIWIMNADGSNPRNLSRSGYDDWDPIWFK